MIRALFVLVAVTSVAMAAVYITDLEDKPEEFKCVPGCYNSELNIVIPINGSAPSKKECKEYHCNEKNVQIFTCGAVAVEPPCKLVTDPSQPYPNCCARPVCPAVNPPKPQIVNN